MSKNAQGGIRQEFANTMLEVGLIDPRLVVMVGDIDHFKLQPFANACPGRYYNIGICEPTIMSMAAGLFKVGFYPVVHTITPFLIERSFEQIKDDFGYQKLGVNIITIGSAFDYGHLGVTHHSYGDFAMMKTIDQSIIYYPATPREFNLLFKQTYTCGKAVYCRIPVGEHSVAIEDKRIKIGHGVKIKDGANLTLVAVGPQLQTVMEALDSLESLGFGTEVLYFPTIKPFDNALLLKSLTKTKRCFVIEEHSEHGGVLEDVLKCANGLGVRVASKNLGATFIHQYGTYEELTELLNFTPKEVVRIVKAAFS